MAVFVVYRCVFDFVGKFSVLSVLNTAFLRGTDAKIRLRCASEVENRHDFLSPSFLSLLLLYFDGKLPRGKYRGVCHVDSDKEQQCLAAGGASRYPAYGVVLFLIAEAALHGGRAQCADYSPCGAYSGVLILFVTSRRFLKNYLRICP